MYIEHIFLNPVPHSRHRLVVTDTSPQSTYCDLQFTKIVKLHVLNLNIVHVQCSLHLLKVKDHDGYYILVTL